jgi:branched-chain amino acid transport system substrate-binding protein
MWPPFKTAFGAGKLRLRCSGSLEVRADRQEDRPRAVLADAMKLLVYRYLAMKTIWCAAFALVLALSGAAKAQTRYDPGASDSEIRIGNTYAYSGPASAYGVIGKTEAAYFRMVNDRGGVNGRRIVFISYDDGYSPPKTVEQTRRLVESDEALAIFNPLGTATSLATIRYLNARKVPQLFISAGAAIFGDHKRYPWSMGGQPSYQSEGRIYANYVLERYPDARIAILSANDDFGRDSVKGFRDGLADKADGMIVAQATYETAEPTIDSQIVKLKASGADLFLNFSTPKFAAMAIRKNAEIGWKPVHILHSVSQSVGSVMKPAGLDNGKGVISAYYAKDPDDPEWRDDPAVKAWSAFMDAYVPDGDRHNTLHVYGYTAAQTLVEILRQCGDDLTRDNVMRQAERLDFEPPMLLPGVRISTSPTDHFPMKQMQMQRFDGEKWVRFGPVIKGEATLD